MADYDVVVVGAGNAALAAAVSAREQGARRVVVLEKAPRELRGGNTHYSGGLLRFAYDRAEDLLPLVPDVEQQVPGFITGVEPYPHKRFREDLDRVTEGRSDPELSEILIGRSYDTVRWMARQGIAMEAAVSLSGVRVGNTIKWSPGAVIRARHEGIGLSAMWFKAAQERDVEIRYATSAVRLNQDAQGRVTGVGVRDGDGFGELTARAVVLGCGGFEANPEWRARYLGRPWDHAKVRGTRYNTGDGLRMALEIGALPCGQWTGCHSTPIDAEAPPHGDRKLTDKTNRLSYPFGVLVDVNGRRFFDEGEDFQFYTYAKLGGIILNQPRRRRLPDLRRQGHGPARGTLQDGQAGDGRLTRRAGGAAAGRSGAHARDAGGVQRRRRLGGVRPDRARWAGDQGAGAAEVELGAAPGHAAVHRVAGDRRHHLHLWRREGGRPGPGAEHQLDAHPRSVRVRRDGRRPLPRQLPGRHRADVGRRLRPDRRRQRGGGVSDAPEHCAAQAHRR